MADHITERKLSRVDRRLLRINRKFDAYFRALGAFVDAFSNVESVIHHCLYHHTGVSNEVRRAVFAGVRIQDGIGYLRRLAEVGVIDPKEWRSMKPLLDRLSILTDKRNKLLHFGVDGVEKDEPFVSNTARALTIDRLEEFPVSVEILDSMTHDLRTIYFAISGYHAGGGYGYTKRDRERLEWRSKEPWQYTPPPPKPRHPRQSDKSARRQRRPPPSQG